MDIKMVEACGFTKVCLDAFHFGSGNKKTNNFYIEKELSSTESEFLHLLANSNISMKNFHKYVKISIVKPKCKIKLAIKCPKCGRRYYADFDSIFVGACKPMETNTVDLCQGYNLIAINVNTGSKIINLYDTQRCFDCDKEYSPANTQIFKDIVVVDEEFLSLITSVGHP